MRNGEEATDPGGWSTQLRRLPRRPGSAPLAGPGFAPRVERGSADGRFVQYKLAACRTSCSASCMLPINVSRCSAAAFPAAAALMARVSGRGGPNGQRRMRALGGFQAGQGPTRGGGKRFFVTPEERSWG